MLEANVRVVEVAKMLYVQGELRAHQFFSSCSQVALPCSSIERLQ